jgi:hypothetical protein
MWQLDAVIEHMHKQYQRSAYLRWESAGGRCKAEKYRKKKHEN